MSCFQWWEKIGSTQSFVYIYALPLYIISFKPNFLNCNVVIYQGELESLRRFKDDVNEVRNGMECGIGVKDYDVKVGDQIEVYKVTEVKRELS